MTGGGLYQLYNVVMISTWGGGGGIAARDVNVNGFLKYSEVSMQN